MALFYLSLIFYTALMSRLAGNGFGAKWGVSWLPEALFCLPFGIAFAWALPFDLWYSIPLGMIAWVISYLGMQAATWMFLRWTKDENPNTKRGATIKPIVDFFTRKFDYELGDEGYSWIAAGVKGFIIGLPVGGFPLALLWPLGYEIGSHTRGKVEKYGIDPQGVSEAVAGAFAGVSIIFFIEMVKLITG